MRQLTVLFLTKDREVLLAMKKRGFGAGRWNGVGGKLEAGETVETAAIRECQEEINVTPSKLVKVAEIVFDEEHLGKRELLHVHVFTSESWKGEPKETEEMSPRWFAKNKIPYAEMWPDDPYWLPQILDGKKVKAEFTLGKDDVLVNYSVTEVTTL